MSDINEWADGGMVEIPLEDAKEDIIRTFIKLGMTKEQAEAEFDKLQKNKNKRKQWTE